MRPAETVRRAFQIDEETFVSLPLGATPAGLGDLFGWLIDQGRFKYELRVEAIWWFAIECAEQPALELVRSFLFNRTWQSKFPDGLTIFSRERFARWLRLRYHVDGDWTDPEQWPVALTPAEQIRIAYGCRPVWQQRHPMVFTSGARANDLLNWLRCNLEMLAPEAQSWLARLDLSSVAHDLVESGVNVLGTFCFPSGLRTSVAALVRSLEEAECRLSLRDVWVAPCLFDAHRLDFAGLEVFDKTIVHVQPEPSIDEAFRRGGWQLSRESLYRIGYWYWELEAVPEHWKTQFAKVDEVWAPTSFIAEAMRKKTDLPVYNMLPGFELPTFKIFPPSHFGLSSDRFTFLFIFNFMSVVERKNPLGLIRSFKEAFGNDESVMLVLKTAFGSSHKEKLNEIEQYSGGNVRVMDCLYSQDETLSLIQSCDCYVSLHRSEGLGLTMAEAMLLGKPVIATGYSGNIDFMDAENSLLVDYERIELTKDYGPYLAGKHWAEPSVAHAATCMRQIHARRDWARDLGARAKVDLEHRLSFKRAGALMTARLREIDSILAERRRFQNQEQR